MGTIPETVVTTVRVKEKYLIAAIKLAIRKAIARTILYARIIVPESKYGDYPPSYVSQELMEGGIRVLQENLLQLESDNDFYTLKLGFPATYASFVNQKPTAGTNWSKITSEGNFYEKLVKYMTVAVKEETDAIFKEINNQTIDISDDLLFDPRLDLLRMISFHNVEMTKYKRKKKKGKKK